MYGDGSFFLLEGEIHGGILIQFEWLLLTIHKSPTSASFFCWKIMIVLFICCMNNKSEANFKVLSPRSVRFSFQLLPSCSDNRLRHKTSKTSLRWLCNLIFVFFFFRKWWWFRSFDELTYFSLLLCFQFLRTFLFRIEFVLEFLRHN